LRAGPERLPGGHSRAYKQIGSGENLCGQGCRKPEIEEVESDAG
jgi:hypothetical protein